MRFRTGIGAVAVLCIALLGGACSADEEEPPVVAADGDREFREYEPFEEVDPYTSDYFIELEDSGLVESQGEERLYNLGVNVCQRLDAGQSVEEQLADDAGLGDQIGSVVGAAVSDLCPQHGDAVEEYLGR